MITADDGFSWLPPRISRAGWTAAFAGTPAEADADACYDAVTRFHVDPLFALAIWTHESDRSRNPQSINARYGNHNPGNLRNPPPSARSIGTDRGQFLDFDTWTDGFSGMAAHLDSTLYRGLTIDEAIRKWAPASDGNDPDGYIAAVLDTMNALADTGGNGGKAMVRIVVSAGHEHISQITAEKIGQESADGLRGGTGALGTEANYNGPVADELVRLLAAAGVDAVRTDACYHADVYGPDADLVIVCHADGIDGSTPPQWGGAAVVYSGPSTTEADSRAQRYVDAWRTVYAQRTGIDAAHLTDHPTDGMQLYYGGWYRSANTPMVLIEHGIWGNNGAQRDDIPAPQLAASADAEAAAQVFDLKGVPDEPTDPGGGGDPGTHGGTPPVAGNGDPHVQRDPRGNVVYVRHDGTGHGIGHGFYRYYADTGFGRDGQQQPVDISPVYGEPLTEEFVIVSPVVRGGAPTVVQYFERARFEWVVDDAETGEGHVELGRVGSEAMEALPPALIPGDAWRG